MSTKKNNKIFKNKNKYFVCCLIWLIVFLRRWSETAAIYKVTVCNKLSQHTDVSFIPMLYIEEIEEKTLINILKTSNSPLFMSNTITKYIKIKTNEQICLDTQKCQR